MNIRFKVDLTNPYLNEPVEVMKIGTRADNALKRNHYKTVMDVVDNWHRLDKIEGIGKKTVKEIKNAFFDFYVSSLNITQEKKFASKITFLPSTPFENVNETLVDFIGLKEALTNERR